MAKQSAGILAYRGSGDDLEIFLVHPGGPFWARKDLGAWSIPKGEFDSEPPLKAALREFYEETGVEIYDGLIELNPIKQKSGKIVYAWAVETDFDADKIESNTFELEWPPKSGVIKTFPEVDRGAWFDVATARKKINPAQADLIEQLVRR